MRVLDEKVGQLPSGARRLYYLLGACPLDVFSIGTVAAVLGHTPEESSPLLDELVNADLLNTDGADAFQFFPLVREHARRHNTEASPGAMSAVLDRLVAWYLAGAINAAGAVRPYRRDAPDAPTYQQVQPPQFDSRDSALGWLEAEAPQMYALAKHLSSLGHDGNREALALMSQLWALWAYRKDFNLWEHCDTLGLGCAQVVGDIDGLGRMQRRLGLLCIHAGRFAEAQGLLDDAISSFEHTEDAHRVATAMASLGLLYLRSGDVNEAVEQLTLAFQLLDERGDQRQAALVLIDLAAAEITRGRPSNALEPLAQAEQVLGDSPDIPSRARALMLRGRAHGLMGDIEQARGELDHAAEQMHACGSTTGLAEATVYLAELARTSHDSLVMDGLLRRAEGLLDKAGVPAKGWLRVLIESLSSSPEQP